MAHALSLLYFLTLLSAAGAVLSFMLADNKPLILRALGWDDVSAVIPLPPRPSRTARQPRVVRTILFAPDALRAAA